MRIDIISAVPDLLESPLNQSILKRAQTKGVVEINVVNLHDYGKGNYHQIDDKGYGGDAGMVIMIEPVYKAITALTSQRDYQYIIYTSPDGEILDQPMANTLSCAENIIILCGHYKGIDHRIREHLINKEISIGNYVLSGGELAAAVICDSIVRLVPGVLNDEQSALSDSFQDNLLAPPIYTRPADFQGWKVPDILLSGDTKKIRDWQEERAIERTEKLRPELLKD
ncbi:MAG: tRNA (guanosine(37)-N1)-methyltransferase TrmD [Bacteroidales bacterium]